MKRKIISLVLSMIMVLSIIPCVEAAAMSGSCGENLTWAYENGVLTISGTGAMDDYYRLINVPWVSEAKNIKTIVLPEGMTHIGACAFSYCDITTISIPNSVSSIGYNAFQNCHSLINIAIPNSITEISEFLFVNCTSLQSIAIPYGVKEIRWFAFSGCSSLKKIMLPNSINLISWGVFDHCTSLESISIPKGIEFISAAAFRGCSSLQSIAIPKSVKNIHDSAFSGCSSLISVDYEGNENDWNSISVAAGNENLLNAKLNYNNYISVAINGNYISFEQRPAIINGRTLVPLRAIFEAMGAKVDWDNNTQTATSTSGSTVIKLTIGSNTLYKNGTAVSLDVPAQLINGHTMVPVRAIAEAFGADVDWDGNTQTVYITTKGNIYTVNTVPQIICDGYNANFADFNGMYIDSFVHSTNNDGSENVKFDIYNTQYIYGIIEIYNSDGSLKDVAIIDKMSNPTDIVGATIDNAGKLIKDLWKGTALTYRQESGYAKKTSVSIDIPKGGYIKITNDMMESFVGSVINLADIAFGAKKTYSSLSGFNSDTSKDFAYELSSELVKNAAFAETVKNPAKNTEKLWEGVSGELYMNSESVSGFLDTVSKNLDEFSDGKLANLIFSTAKSCGIGIAESTFEALTGPVGAALKAIFTITSVTDILTEMNDGVDCLYQGSIEIKAPQAV